MGAFGDLAFAAVDNFLKNEIIKKIDTCLSAESAAELVRKMETSQRRGASLEVKGHVKTSVREIVVEYTGTAMRKTSERTVHIPDQKKEFELTETLPSPGPMRDGDTIPENAPTAGISFNTAFSMDNINLEEGMGSLHAKVRKLSFKATIEIQAESAYKPC